MYRIARLTIGRKLALGFAVLMVLMLFSAGFAYMKMVSASAIQERIRTVRYPATLDGARIQAALGDTASALRAYVLFGSDSSDAARFKAKRAEAWQTADAAMKELIETSQNSGIASQVQQVSSIADLLGGYHQLQNKIEALAIGQGNEAMGRAYDMLKTEATAQQDQLATQLKKLVDEQRDKTGEEIAALAAASRAASFVLWATTLLGILAGCVIAYFFARRMSNAFRQMEKSLVAVAAGDFTNQVQIDTKDEIGRMGQALNSCVATLNVMLTEMSRMHAAQKAGDIEAYAPEDKFAGAWRQLAAGANENVRLHVNNILKILGILSAYAEGDFGPELEKLPGKQAIANDKMDLLRNNLLGVISETTRMAEAQRAGDIDAYVPEEKFSGAWRQLAAGANEGVRLHLNNTLKILAILSDYAEGDFSPVLEKLPGKQAIANDKMDLLRNNLQRVSKEVNDLTAAILKGKLAARGHAQAFAGDWQRLVTGLNSLIDAFVKPINLMAEYVNRVGKGDIPPRIAESYNGDFNDIKNNLNACIDGLGGLVEANQVLQRIAVNDHTARVAGSYQGIFAEVARATNQALDRVINAREICQRVATGDYTAKLEEARKIGRRSAKDEFLPSLIRMMETVNALVADVQALSSAAIEGKLSSRADASKHQGEYRKVIQGVNSTLEAVTAPLQESGRVLQRIAEGDLTARVLGDYQGDHAAIKDDINRMAETLSASMGSIGQNSQALANSAEELTAISHQMSSNAEETSAQSNVVSVTAEQVTNNLQTVATSTEEMTASIKEIAKNANEASRIANSAVKAAENTNAMVSKLGQASNEIGQVIKVITSIAQQTNLLALNATIEAARAGEAGKGFAVVANEVKELAKETAKATEDITQKIEGIQADTRGAVEAIAAISSVIGQIDDISNTIASAVEEQTATTNEIARNVAEAARGGQQVGENIEAVATAARGTTSGAADTQNAAAELARMAAELQTLISQFRYEEARTMPSSQSQRQRGVRAA